ncbi:MAG: hypothetical protein JJV93_00475 [Alphaproteobacteria bacterium]|nr:hypothetical protein [Alphaproteobacteria bacterium]MBL0717728.1 hypothetical protein [Alphaproteobacteria bacterium]
MKKNKTLKNIIGLSLVLCIIIVVIITTTIEQKKSKIAIIAEGFCSHIIFSNNKITRDGSFIPNRLHESTQILKECRQKIEGDIVYLRKFKVYKLKHKETRLFIHKNVLQLNDNKVYHIFWQNNVADGTFSQVINVHSSDDIITFYSLTPVGNRCNGGIDKIFLVDNKIKVIVNQTWENLLFENGNKTLYRKLYGDISSCPACCLSSLNLEFISKNDILEINSYEVYISVEDIKKLTDSKIKTCLQNMNKNKDIRFPKKKFENKLKSCTL